MTQIHIQSNRFIQIFIARVTLNESCTRFHQICTKDDEFSHVVLHCILRHYIMRNAIIRYTCIISCTIQILGISVLPFPRRDSCTPASVGRETHWTFVPDGWSNLMNMGVYLMDPYR